MKLHPVVAAILGGIVAALMVAGPLVDNGLKPSDIIAIVLAGLSGTGLTAVRPPSKGKHVAE